MIKIHFSVLNWWSIGGKSINPLEKMPFEINPLDKMPIGINPSDKMSFEPDAVAVGSGMCKGNRIQSVNKQGGNDCGWR